MTIFKQIMIWILAIVGVAGFVHWTVSGVYDAERKQKSQEIIAKAREEQRVAALANEVTRLRLDAAKKGGIEAERRKNHPTAAEMAEDLQRKGKGSESIEDDEAPPFVPQGRAYRKAEEEFKR